jgi:plastocyanin
MFTRITTHPLATTTFVALAALALLAAGCSSDAGADPTPVKVFKITPAPPTSASGTATSVTDAPTATPSASGAATTLELTGRDSMFDTEDLAAAAGAVTIKFSNKDAGVIHNLHVYQGMDAKGASVAKTDLAAGPVEQELQFDLAPGAYHFQCDAHPNTMAGTLTVR